MTQKLEVIWAKTAHLDLEAIIHHIRADNPLAAIDNLSKIKTRVADLVLFPQQGRICLS